MFNIYDAVKIFDTKNNLIKEGIIVKMTNSGAEVYSPKCEKPFSDSIEFAEWFPFKSKETRMLRVQTKQKKI